MDKNAKIYVAGHRGLVGSALVKILQKKGYSNIITQTHSELDLIDSVAVADFFNREQLKAQFNNPGYVESYFPQTESFWIFIKDPPKGEYAVNYARVVCNQAKNKYNVRGFTITIWGLSDKKKQGKFSCF